MTKPHTRHATEADVFAMEQIMRDAFSESYVNFMPEDYIREWYDNDTAAKSVQKNLKHTGVVEIKNQIAGFLIRTQDYIADIWVSPSHQKQGAGRALMRWAEETARAAGQTTLWLYCYEANKTALAFYKKHGFELVEKFPSTDVPGGPVTVCKLRKALYAEE